MQRIEPDIDFESAETCPNCSTFVGSQSTCPNCGAVLFEEGDLNLFDEDGDVD